MAPGKPEKLTNDAIKAVEKVAESKEEGAALAQQLKEAHESLDNALKHSQSLEEQLSLQIALKDIQDLEKTLVKRGKAKKLTEGQKAELKELSDDLMRKVGNLDFIVDVVRFRDDFLGKITKRNKALASLSIEISLEGVSPQFKKAANDALKMSEDLSRDCYSYYENFNAQFGYDIPKEIQAEFEKMFAELAKLENSDKTIRNSLEFIKLDAEFAKTGGKMASINLENLRSKIAILKEQGLVSGLKDYAEQRLNQLAWNINVKQSFEEMEPQTVLARLKSEEALMQAQHYTKEFDEILGWLVSNVLYSDSKENLPTDSKFYKDLYSLVKKRLQRANSNEVLANGKIMLSQIAILAANVAHAEAYRPGVEIWHFKKIDQPVYDPASDIPAGSAEEMESARGSWRASDNDEWKNFGTIEMVDIFDGKIKLREYDMLFDLTYFENSEYFFKENGPQAYVAIADIVNGGEKAEFLKKAEKDMKEAEVLVLKSSIEDLNNEVRIIDAHIPKISLFRRFVDDGWVKIGDGGKISIHCPDENIEDVYKEVLKQFEVEKMYAQGAQLVEIEQKFPEKVKEDPFFAARKLLVQAKIEMAGGQEYEARGSLVKFLNQMNVVKAERDEDMKNAEEFAKETLIEFALKSLARLKNLAIQMYGQEEKQKTFLDRVLARLDAESARLETSDDWEIKVNNLTLAPSDVMGKEAYEAGCEKAGIKPDFSSSSNVATISAAKPERDAGRGEKIAKLVEQGRGEYLIDHEPPVGILELWNEIVLTESADQYVAMSDGSKRRQKFEKLGDKLRHTSGSGEWVEGKDLLGTKSQKMRWAEGEHTIHPEAAVMFYREALGDEIKDAEFALMHLRNKLVSKEKSEKRELYLAKAREEITKELGSEKLRMNLAGSEQVISAILADPKTMDAMANQLIDRFVEEKMRMAVYRRFYNGRINGEAKDIWAKINDIEDPFDETWNWSDRTSQHITEELVLNAVIMAASFGIGEIVTSGARLGYLALRGLSAAKATEEATLAYRLGVLGTRTVNFTLAEKSIHSIFLKQNTWGSFGTDLSLNLAMFGGIGMGMHFWEKALGKELVGAAKGAKIFETRTNLAFAESPLYQSAAFVGERGIGRLSLGQMGLRGVNWLGRLSTEGVLFIGMGIGQKLTIGEMKWEDISMAKEFGMNLLTILSMRAGNMLFAPVFKPVLHSAEVKARRMVEDADHAVFLKNAGLSEDYFSTARTSNKSPEKVFLAERVLMDELQNFRGRHGLADDFFTGKSLEQIRKVMRKVSDFMQKHGSGGMFELPNREDLMSLYRIDKDAFAVIASKLNVWPLELADAQEMYKATPYLVIQFAGKLPKFRQWILKMAKEQARVDRKMARELDEGITESGEVVIDPLMESLLSGPEGFAHGITLIEGMDHLTFSTYQLLYITRNLPDQAARELFFKVCSKKMSPIQKIQFEEMLQVADRAPEAHETEDGSTVLQVLRKFARLNSGWMLRVAMASFAALALKVATPDFSVVSGKPNKPAATWVAGADLSKLPEARNAGADGKGGSESVLFDLGAGKARDAGKALESGWKTKTQDQLCDEMAEQGMTNELINEVRVEHAKLNPDLQRYVKILVKQGTNDELEPYVLVDQEGMQAEFGLGVAEVKQLLQKSGLLMPENLLELAKQAGISPSEMASISGVKEVDLAKMPIKQAGLGLHAIIFFLTGGTVHAAWGLWKLWKITENWRQNRRLKKLEGRPKTGSTGDGGGKGPEGPKVGPAKLPEKLEEILKDVLDGAKLKDKLDPAQITILQKIFDEFKKATQHFQYLDPDANIEAIGRIWMKIQYLELRLQKFHGAAGAPAVGRTVADIEAEIEGRTVNDLIAEKNKLGGRNHNQSLLGGLRPMADVQADLKKPGLKKDEVKRLNTELNERNELEGKLREITAIEADIVKLRLLLTEKDALTKHAQSSEEREEAIRELNAAYTQLLGLHTGAVGVVKGKGTKKSLLKGKVKGKIENDLSPTATDLTPDKIKATMNEITDFLKHSGDFKRLKELEIAVLLGAKKHTDMEKIAAANDPANPQLESAKAYEAFYKQLLADRDALRASTHGIMGGALLRVPGIRQVLASDHPIRNIIIALALITLAGITGYNLLTGKKKEKNNGGGNLIKQIEDGHKDIDEKGLNDDMRIMLEKIEAMDLTPNVPADGSKGSSKTNDSGAVQGSEPKSDQSLQNDQPTVYKPRFDKAYQLKNIAPWAEEKAKREEMRKIVNEELKKRKDAGEL